MDAYARLLVYKYHFFSAPGLAWLFRWIFDVCSLASYLRCVALFVSTTQLSPYIPCGYSNEYPCQTGERCLWIEVNN